MRIVLADLVSTDGFVSKDTVAGGYGSRLRPFTRVTRVVVAMKRRLHDVPSVQLGQAAALFAAAGHEVVVSRGEAAEGDVAIVLSSLVDYRRETAWAQAHRARGLRVGFLGLAASKMPELFEDSADFVIIGEPEHAVMRLAAGEQLEGRVQSPALDDLDTLPFPRWDLLRARERRWMKLPFAGRPFGGMFPVMASRSCPEFCTYCPHRILAPHRMRSPGNIAEEIEYLASLQPEPYIIFRDPLFTDDRDRVLALCAEFERRGLTIKFECETRLDHLDPVLLDTMHRAGLSAISFGVETISPDTLKKSGRRYIPEAQQQLVIEECRRRGIVTAGFYVFGFLQDTWDSIAATIDHAVELGSTVAQFKILTPYPGTPMWKQLQPYIVETDWEKFDGFTPTFQHPNLSETELRFLLGAAYTRFYMRPSYLANYLRVGEAGRGFIDWCDTLVSARHGREERALMARAVTC
ncbi:MAG TPA: radical SAM protein [Vicinamibacterales bacterium]|nr:radical SAM protein [Vicinamibacterales bacterium]